MEELIIQAIQKSIAENSEKHNGRDYALKSEVKRVLFADFDTYLSNLQSQGKIITGRTINDTWIKPIIS